MEVLETTEKGPEQGSGQAGKTVEEQKKEIFAAAAKALDDAENRVAEKDGEAQAKAPKGEPLEGKLDADVDEHVASHPVLSTASEGTGDRFGEIADGSHGNRVVEISQEEKDAFLDSVVSGSRYTGKGILFGGRVRVAFRSRSSAESEAIDSFLRYRGSHNIIQNGVAYADALRFCILAAGVESLNDSKFPTLTDASNGIDGLFYREEKEGTKDPEWLWLFNKWRSMPESVVAAVLEEYFSFEAKYWKMIERAGDENFWSPGGSTGE